MISNISNIELKTEKPEIRTFQFSSIIPLDELFKIGEIVIIDETRGKVIKINDNEVSIELCAN